MPSSSIPLLSFLSLCCSPCFPIKLRKVRYSTTRPTSRFTASDMNRSLFLLDITSTETVYLEQDHPGTCPRTE